jgi:hypothetical protein
LIQLIWETQGQGAHVLQCTTGYQSVPERHPIRADRGGVLFGGTLSLEIYRSQSLQ